MANVIQYAMARKASQLRIAAAERGLSARELRTYEVCMECVTRIAYLEDLQEKPRS